MLLKSFSAETKMYDKNNIFAKIISKEIPCDLVYEDDKVMFFNDINPQAKVHILEYLNKMLLILPILSSKQIIQQSNIFSQKL